MRAPRKSSNRQKFDIGIDMKEAYAWVLGQQEKIARAKRTGDSTAAEELGQELVTNSYAQAVAVQTVATNRGARSPGLSIEGFCTNQDYKDMVDKLDTIVTYPEDYKATPLDRIYISKKDGRLRPISIPSYVDRCLQALYKLALEPISEELADLSSYGFRPIRSVSWAVGRTLNAMANPLTRYGFVVEVDIMGCFDNIDHDFIKQITPTIPKKILREWLSCGYVERGTKTVLPTEQGVPQGGILSPLLTNLTLDGLEDFIKSRIIAAKTGSIGSSFCRYADDMVIFVTTSQNAAIALDAVKEFLAIRGLQVKEAKTRITNLQESAFEFLGFEFSLVYRRNRKRKSAKVGIPTSAVRRFRDKINLIFKSNKLPHVMIDEANRVISGWGYAYRFAHDSIYIFRGLRYWIWKQFHWMCTKRLRRQFDKANRTQVNDHVMSRFFEQHESYSTWPCVRDERGIPHYLFDITSIEYTPPIFTNKAKNAFILEDREILDTISLKSKTKFHAAVLERWSCCCGLCRKPLEIDRIPYELHHIVPKRFGGKDTPANLVPLCKSPCHNMVSTSIQRNDVEEILTYIGLGILEIPYNYLEAIIANSK